jgi:cbb3-type cytochrome oxidase cytochrome c subunit
MSRPFKLPPQLLRLLLLAIGIVGAYLVARYFLTPPSFRQYGWYRGDALAEVAAREPVFAGKKACEECHSDQVQKLAKYEHKTLSCESCHGVGREHADNPDIAIVKLTFSHCVRCHEADPSRPKWLKQINTREHYTGQRCTECHIPHQPNEVP